MDVDTIVQDCLNKGYVVIFRPRPAIPGWECSVVRESDHVPGERSRFAVGTTLVDSVIIAARYACVPGY